MEWNVLIIILLALIYFESVSSIDCPNAGLIPDPENCQCFYECGHAHDEGVEFCCSEGLYFSAAGICDWDVPDNNTNDTNNNYSPNNIEWNNNSNT